jgi:hypothetical protein
VILNSVIESERSDDDDDGRRKHAEQSRALNSAERLTVFQNTQNFFSDTVLQ